jgi:beta-glucosidase
MVYYPGLEGGNALTRILFGEVAPSGKLPVTFPKRLEDTPAFVNYPGSMEVLYGEGIFVGYRYYEIKDVDPLFPFGHGLSYTTFAYENFRVLSEGTIGKPVRISIQVKNTGNCAAQEVVQLYVGDRQASLARPVKELKGFQKIMLQPGEVKTVEFTLEPRAFAFYDPYRKKWIVEPGEFEILVGSSSRDIRAKKIIKL